MHPPLRPALPLALLIVSSCAEERGLLTVAEPDPEPVLDTPEDTDTGTACANPLLAWSPDDGAEDVPLSSPISARLTFHEEDVSIRLRASGRDVPVRLVTSPGNPVFGFEALQPLRAGADHQASLTWSCGAARITWRTAETTFAALPAQGRLIAPATDLPLNQGLGDVLLGLSGLGAGRVEWRVAGSLGGAQDPCLPSSLATGPLREDGRFEAQSPSMVWRVGGQPSPVRASRFVADLAADERGVEGLRWSGVVDARPIARQLFGAAAGPDRVCGAVAGGCELCPDDVRACVALAIEGIPVARVDATVTDRSADEVASDPQCGGE